MPLIASLTGVSVNGTLVKVLDRALDGIFVSSIAVHNAGANAVTAASLRSAAAPGLGEVEFDASLHPAPGSSLGVAIGRRLDALALYLTCVAGTLVNITLTSADMDDDGDTSGGTTTVVPAAAAGPAWSLIT